MRTAAASRVLVCLVPIALASCLGHPQWAGRDSLLDVTAGTLDRGRVQVGIGAVGTRYDDVGLSIPVHVGVVGGLQLSTNVAHDIVSILNLSAKWRFVDAKGFSIAAGAGIKWMNPKNLWMLPDETRDRYSKVNVYLVPVRLSLSWAATSWMGIHLHANYTWSGLDARLPPDDLLSRAGFGGHEVVLEPVLTFFPVHGWALIAGVQAPVFSEVTVLADTETYVSPGIYMGVLGTQKKRLDVADLVTLVIGSELVWEAFRLRLSVTRGLRFLERRAGWLPAVDVAWRF